MKKFFIMAALFILLIPACSKDKANPESQQAGDKASDPAVENAAAPEAQPNEPEVLTIESSWFCPNEKYDANKPTRREQGFRLAFFPEQKIVILTNNNGGSSKIDQYGYEVEGDQLILPERQILPKRTFTFKIENKSLTLTDNENQTVYSCFHRKPNE